VLRAAGVAERCSLVAGDYTVEIPSGDAYIFGSVMMDLDNARAVEVLKVSRRASTPGGRLLVIERVIPPADGGPSLAHLSDVMCIVVTGGRVRSEVEFRRLFESGGVSSRDRSAYLTGMRSWRPAV
jgi:hypothetical protein